MVSVKLVAPFVWPGWWCAVTVTPPSAIRVPILQPAIDAHGLEVRVRVVAETKVALATVLEQHGVGFRHPHLRTRAPLQLGEARDVIEVRVRRQQDLHVVEIEAELLDAFLDLRHRLDETGVDQNVAGVRRNEIRREIVRADPIDVADQPERRKRLRPLAAILRDCGGARWTATRSTHAKACCFSPSYRHRNSFSAKGKHTSNHAASTPICGAICANVAP